ncbi:MAG: hypothetical protein ABI280_07770 [Ginsengibacter sp.]
MEALVVGRPNVGMADSFSNFLYTASTNFSAECKDHFPLNNEQSS